MDVTRRVAGACRAVATETRTWSARRIAGEATLLVLTAGATTFGLAWYGPPMMAAGAVFAGVLCLLRRAFPATVLVLVGAATGAFSSFWLLMMVVGWSAGRRIEGTWRVVAAFTASGVLFSVLSLVLHLGGMLPRLVMITALTFLTTTLLPGVVSRYRGQRKALVQALHEHNTQLLRERQLVASHARLRERQRIAQDMHDSLGHQLALLALQTGALEVDPTLTDEQRGTVAVLREASSTALRELRDAVGVLHEGEPGKPRQDSGSSTPRGTAGIDGLVESSRNAGASVTLRRSGEERPLAPAGGQAAYRVVQESLTNALKHAPGAPITVELRYEPDTLVVEIANGPVPVPAGVGVGGVGVGVGGVGVGGRGAGAVQPVEVVSGGQGLTGLRERARLVGGMVHTGPTPDGGFRVAALLPYGSPPPSTGGGQSGGQPSADRPGSEREVEPFVDSADDFPGHRWAPPGGDGGTVIDWTGPPERQKEINRAMGRRRKGLAIGCGAALLCASGIGALVGWAIWEVSRVEVSPALYESIRTGQNEHSVREKLPGASVLLNTAVNDGPPPPDDATCLVLMSTEQPDNLNKTLVYRFCFRDGELVQKLSYMTDA
ncbi:histidine kinase [Streptomyces sp. SM14]|uniref:ATP-binding protein n=1 Tax=Streptomyces sp. SM14 TaxID=1736045 RepID=UPI0021566C9B|nr:histidine kinase [Streptomyces sp. SM14]